MDNNEQNFINIVNASENNLKHVSLKFQRKRLPSLPVYPDRVSLPFVLIRSRQNQEEN